MHTKMSAQNFEGQITGGQRQCFVATYFKIVYAMGKIVYASLGKSDFMEYDYNRAECHHMTNKDTDSRHCVQNTDELFRQLRKQKFYWPSREPLIGTCLRARVHIGLNRAQIPEPGPR